MSQTYVPSTIDTCEVELDEQSAGGLRRLTILSTAELAARLVSRSG